ncbi:hypothetical protein MJI12_27210, partial [Salmonella enterica subsp. enterica serovar Kentucky]|nr:hypothetical protein [Salmonella enterica subsp. enterica serovar Kentucky]
IRQRTLYCPALSRKTSICWLEAIAAYLLPLDSLVPVRQTPAPYTANYVATKDTVTTGYGNAEVDFNLSYE